MKRIFINLVVLCLFSPAAQAASITDVVLNVGYQVLPVSVLRAGLYKVAPQDAALVDRKLGGLHRQCQVLSKQSKKANQVDSRLTVFSPKDLAKVKNDHLNALLRVREMRSYLEKLSSEITNYGNSLTNSQRIKPQIAVEHHINSLPGQSFGFIKASSRRLQTYKVISPSHYPRLLQGLQRLIHQEFLPHLKKLEKTIQHKEYQECAQQLRGFYNA